MDYEVSKSTERIPLPSYQTPRAPQFSSNLGVLMDFIGLTTALICGFIFGKYMQELHETKLWFSHITQTEQEISLRTEAGFYYSYYKIAVHPKMLLINTIYALTHDNATEYPRQINVLERFNIYQELILALLYKFVASFEWIHPYLPKPILFYAYSCFACAGFGVTSLFLLAWALTGSWLYGLLVFTWMIVNLDDSTRVFFTVNLRENFALPFFWLQNACAVIILQRFGVSSKKYHFIFFLSTSLFALFWQFSQFILLLESISLVGMSLCVPQLSSTVIVLLLLQSHAFFLVVVAQFGQPMSTASLCTAFNLSCIVILYLTSTTKRNTIITVLLKFLYIVALTVPVSQLIRYLVGVEADSHIWTFVKAKIGLISRSSVPFESALYLCHGAFAYLDSDFFRRTSLNGCFPLFTAAVLTVAVVLVYSIIMQSYGRQTSVPAFFAYFGPEAVFIVLQSVLCGIIAVFTLRMKYLWFPQITVVACILPVILSKWSGRLVVQLAVLAAIISLLNNHYAVYKEQMSNEQEFYDPDTVALMEWIKKSTRPLTSWSGSMQLMAGVKACTGRYLANHPHFEDKWLRDRTLQLYQMYGRRTPIEMYKILRSHKVDYIILEDSICMARSTGCTTNDLVDLANGDTPEYLMSKESDPKKRVPHLRFCDRVRYNDEETKRYFKPVFENPTFRVYQVLEQKILHFDVRTGEVHVTGIAVFYLPKKKGLRPTETPNRVQENVIEQHQCI